MKQKIAVFCNGWSGEYLEQVLQGIHTRAALDKIDIYTFMNYSSGSEDTKDSQGEKCIFTLPDLTMFDGVILLGNTLHLASEREYLNRKILNNNIPAVSLEYLFDGIPSIGTDTYTGVYELTSHIIREHQARHIVYVSGPEDNKESQSRMQAVRDALSEISATLEPQDIIYGLWSYYGAHTAVSKWLETNELPDAFVCANDEMALAVCALLDTRGVVVPEQVIVTGCDCISLSQKIYPMLSTVARDWDRLGYNGLEQVLKQINKEQVPPLTICHSTPTYGESCGCKVTDARIQARRRSIISQHKQQKENTIYEWHLRQIDDMMAHITGIRDLKDHLGWNFSYNHAYEGNNFLLCLVDSFTDQDFHNDFTPEMDVYLHFENEKILPCSKFPAKNLLPALKVSSEESNTFLFLPIHLQGDVLGYAVFINHSEIAYNTDQLYAWTRHIGQDLDRVRQNIRMKELNKMLTEISVTDALTGLKNRAGYDSLAIPLLQQCKREGKTSAMIFADVNRMKLINDRYGHLQGDYALCTVAEAIKRTLPSRWVAVRFGGDEFIMIGECESPEQAEEIKLRLSQNLELLKNERELCFPLTASFGAAVISPEEHYSPEEYLRKADQSMYIMKQLAHQNTDSSI